jgi:VIT1/CCC1 family predicted Fe2+/Mn2+ transporter
MLTGNSNVGAEDCWKQAAFSFKFYFLTSLIIFFISLLIPAVSMLFIDIPEYTIWSFQIWRLVLSMYGQTFGIMSILNIVFSFLWMYSILKVAII